MTSAGWSSCWIIPAGMESREKEVSDQGVEWSEWKGLIFMMLWFRRGRIFEIVKIQNHFKQTCSAEKKEF